MFKFKEGKISTAGIHRIFGGLKFEPDAEIGHKVPFCKGLNRTFLTKDELTYVQCQVNVKLNIFCIII